MNEWTPMKTRVAIFGAGDHGIVALHVLRASGHDVVGFLDDDPTREATPPLDLPMLGDASWFSRPSAKETSAFVAIGDNTVRRTTSARLRAAGVPILSAIHPSAVVMAGVHLGSGVFVGPTAVLVSGVWVGDDVIVNTAATVDHHGRLMPGAHVAPGVHTGGRVTIGEESLIGIGATLSAGVCVGSRSVVGAGSVVLEDAPPQVVVAGVPARLLRTLDGPIDWASMLRPDRDARVRST
jgi:sugar O-acyltransferase (sialic acid O-acetyltransferase NeuD family)